MITYTIKHPKTGKVHDQVTVGSIQEVNQVLMYQALGWKVVRNK